MQRNCVFATNPNFIIPKSQQPDDAYLSYFKLTLFDPPEFIVWNIYGLRHFVLKKLKFKIRVYGKDSIPLHPFLRNKTSKMFLLSSQILPTLNHFVNKNFV